MHSRKTIDWKESAEDIIQRSQRLLEDSARILGRCQRLQAQSALILHQAERLRKEFLLGRQAFHEQADFPKTAHPSNITR